MINSLIQLSFMRGCALIVMTVGMASSVQAQHLHNDLTPRTSAQIQAGKSLKNILRDEIRRCPSLKCANSRVQLERMQISEIESLSKQARKQMRDHAIEMAREYWPDTILEGPYHVRFNIRLERESIDQLLVDGQFVGYRVAYSDKAWDLDECKPVTAVNVSGDPEGLPDLDTCASGRIFDRAFVTADFSFSFRDESTYARYRAGAE